MVPNSPGAPRSGQKHGEQSILPGCQCGASSYHGNEESSASSITLVMVQSMTAGGVLHSAKSPAHLGGILCDWGLQEPWTFLGSSVGRQHLKEYRWECPRRRAVGLQGCDQE